MNERSSEAVCPDFLYIGTAKAGSSWIYEILREHPEVFVPKAKDIQFFDDKYEKGIKWYLSLFSGAKGRKAVGELSHNYFIHQEAAERIGRYFPDMRLLCCLREPVDQITSNFLQRKIQSVDRDLAFEEFAFREDVLRAVDYYYNLLPFYDVFPREQILVLFFDDLRRDSSLFAERIYRFLEVDTAFRPSVLRRKVLPARKPRFFWLAHLAYQVGRVFREIGLVNVVGTVKRNAVFQALLYRELEKRPEMPNAVKARLQEYLRPRYQNLPNLIQQPLPEEWGF